MLYLNYICFIYIEILDLNMNPVRKEIIKHCGKTLCHIGVVEYGGEIRTTIQGFIELGKCERNEAMSLLKDQLKSEVSLFGDIKSYPTILIHGGDYREKVKEIFIENGLYNEDQIQIWPSNIK